MRSLGDKPTTAEKIEVSKRRGKLKARIAEHQKNARHFLKLTEEEENHEQFDFEEEEVVVDGEDNDDDNPFITNNSYLDIADIECFAISLPSSLTPTVRQERSLAKATQAELNLRVGQCNDALQAIRMAVGKKAFVYITKVRNAQGKKGKTKSYDEVKLAVKSLRHQAQLYRSSRKTLVLLGADADIREKYQNLETNQLSTKNTFLDVNERGQKHENLAWYWKLDVAGDTKNDEMMEECTCSSIFSIFYIKDIPVYRVNWLRARAAYDRAREEVQLVQLEMDWTVRYFQHYSRKWAGLAKVEKTGGHLCYAVKTAVMWERFANCAQSSFEKVLTPITMDVLQPQAIIPSLDKKTDL